MCFWCLERFSIVQNASFAMAEGMVHTFFEHLFQITDSLFNLFNRQVSFETKTLVPEYSHLKNLFHNVHICCQSYILSILTANQENRCYFQVRKIFHK